MHTVRLSNVHTKLVILLACMALLGGGTAGRCPRNDGDLAARLGPSATRHILMPRRCEDTLVPDVLCHQATSHLVHDMVSHRLAALEASLSCLSACVLPLLTSIVWSVSVGRRFGLDCAFIPLRKHSPDGLRTAAGRGPLSLFPRLLSWSIARCWAGPVRGQFWRAVRVPAATRVAFWCFALSVLPAAVSCRKSGLRRTGCVHMPAGNANIWWPSPPRFLSPLSFPSRWCHAERAPFGARMGSVFAPWLLRLESCFPLLFGDHPDRISRLRRPCSHARTHPARARPADTPLRCAQPR